MHFRGQSPVKKWLRIISCVCSHGSIAIILNEPSKFTLTKHRSFWKAKNLQITEKIYFIKKKTQFLLLLKLLKTLHK